MIKAPSILIFIFLFSTALGQTISVENKTKINFTVSNLPNDTTLNSSNLCKLAHLLCYEEEAGKGVTGGGKTYEEEAGKGVTGGGKTYEEEAGKCVKIYEEEAGKGNSAYRIYTFRAYATGDDKHLPFRRYSHITYANGHEIFNSNAKGVMNGVFFREMILKSGSIMSIPDIIDKFPRRDFLPRWIFSPASSEVQQLYNVFKNNFLMKNMMDKAISDCEMPASEGETKKCVVTVEGMIDFVTQVLGTKADIRTTNNVKGSAENILLGRVESIKSGSVVSCHQSLFPSVMYLCHHVPNVRLYNAEWLDLKVKRLVNNGIIICHLNTTTWSPNHIAFELLGSGPGKIEACHWIYEHDLVWV